MKKVQFSEEFLLDSYQYILYRTDINTREKVNFDYVNDESYEEVIDESEFESVHTYELSNIYRDYGNGYKKDLSIDKNLRNKLFSKLISKTKDSKNPLYYQYDIDGSESRLEITLSSNSSEYIIIFDKI